MDGQVSNSNTTAGVLNQLLPGMDPFLDPNALGFPKIH